MRFALAPVALMLIRRSIHFELIVETVNYTDRMRERSRDATQSEAMDESLLHVDLKMPLGRDVIRIGTDQLGRKDFVAIRAVVHGKFHVLLPKRNRIDLSSHVIHRGNTFIQPPTYSTPLTGS